MPRTSRTTESRLSTVPKRNARRNASKHQIVYEHVESPSEDKGRQSQESYTDEYSVETAAAPVMNTREMSASTSSTAIYPTGESTPTKKHLPIVNNTSTAAHKTGMPGFEALEAVNLLYQQLKDSRSEVDLLSRQNTSLSLDLQKQQKMVHNLRAEIKIEKEKFNKAQQLHEKEIQSLHQGSEDDLVSTLDALHRFNSAAKDLMPLLDVLAGSAEVHYDSQTEKLYQVLRKHRLEDLR